MHDNQRLGRDRSLVRRLINFVPFFANQTHRHFDGDFAERTVGSTNFEQSHHLALRFWRAPNDVFNQRRRVNLFIGCGGRKTFRSLGKSRTDQTEEENKVFHLGRNAMGSASEICLAKCTVILSRMSAGTSSQSLRFSSGNRTCFKPLRAAARTFSLMPPTGSTRPRKLISPVIAKSDRTGRRIKSDASATVIVTPALGPSLGVAPAGTWICMSYL